jgi:hypothetical protein
MNRFKRNILRGYINFKWYFSRVKSRFETQELPDNRPIQIKSFRLWKLLLKDQDSVISCSMVNKTRQIERDNMLLILTPMNEVDHLMTIMDVDDHKSCLYEIRFSNKSSQNLIELFDTENEKRMQDGQSEKRNSIHNDLDKLLKQQEDVLKKQKRNQLSS